jgi:hypothetical protein
VVAVADAAVGPVVGATAVMAQRAARLRLLLLQQRRMPHRIFLPTRMQCLFLRRHPRAAVAVVVVEAVALETPRQQ